MDALKELQKLYNNNELITDDIKSESWSIRGISGSYFRLIVTGEKKNKEPFDEDVIEGCLNALKQAFKNDISRRNKLNENI